MKCMEIFRPRALTFTHTVAFSLRYVTSLGNRNAWLNIIQAFTGEIPFEEEQDLQVPREQGKTPLSYYSPGTTKDKQRHQLKDEHRLILTRCLRYIPEHRPSALTLVEEVEKLLVDLPV